MIFSFKIHSPKIVTFHPLKIGEIGEVYIEIFLKKFDIFVILLMSMTRIST